jgi:hypothetical protein
VSCSVKENLRSFAGSTNSIAAGRKTCPCFDALRASCQLCKRLAVARTRRISYSIPLPKAGGDWQVSYNWQSRDVGQGTIPISVEKLKEGKAEIDIPFATVDETPPRSPGISGKLRFVISLWNQD